MRYVLRAFLLARLSPTVHTVPTTLTDTGLVHTLASGRKVTAIPQPDGTIVVPDLPLFSVVYETDAGVQDGARKPRSLEWLQEAKRRHEIRRDHLGYQPPLALRHFFDSPKRVGTYRLKDIRPEQVNPDEAPRPTIFHDQVFHDREAFEEGKSYDFRSPEISQDEDREFSAVALLKDKPPFGKYPNTKPELIEAYYSRPGVSGQVWARETFETANALDDIRAEKMRKYAAAVDREQAAVDRMREQDRQKASKKPARRDLDEDEEVLRRNRGRFETTPQEQEGAMPAADVKAPDKKAPESMDEKIDAMVAKCFAAYESKLTAKFESMLKEGKDKPEAGEEKPEQKVEDKKPEPKPETNGSLQPADILPPAVSQARGTPPAQIESFAARLSTVETANLGLRARVEQMQREKDAVTHVKKAKQILSDLGIAAPTEAFEARLTKAAVAGGEAAVLSLVEDVKLAMGSFSPSSGPETFGASHAPAFQPGVRGDADELKKAIEAFGSTPEAVREIRETYASYQTEVPANIRASVSFMDLCRGDRRINRDGVGLGAKRGA